MKAVIFDFNGTLFFDTEKHQEAWLLYGQQILGRPLTQEEFQTSILGRSNRLILTYLLGREATDAETAAMGGEKEALYRQLCLADPAHLCLAPGAPALLDALLAQGIPVTIATSSDRENLDFYFAQFGLSRWFAPEKCVFEDGSFASKPAPDIYQRAMARLGAEPGDCTVFEDAVSGIRAAHNAGAGKIIAVASSGAPDFLAGLPGVSRVVPDYRGLTPADL